MEFEKAYEIAKLLKDKDDEVERLKEALKYAIGRLTVAHQNHGSLVFTEAGLQEEIKNIKRMAEVTE